MLTSHLFFTPIFVLLYHKFVNISTVSSVRICLQTRKQRKARKCIYKISKNFRVELVKLRLRRSDVSLSA